MKKSLLLIIGVPALLIFGLVLYLSFGDLSGLCGLAEDAASEALGRELRIAGRCEPELWSPARVLVEDVTLAGATWGGETEMVQIDRFEISLSLWSLIDRPLRIHQLQLEGVSLLLEKDESGRANWEFAVGEEDEEASAEAAAEGAGEAPGIPLIAESVEVTSTEIVYWDAAQGTKHALAVDHLSLGLAASGMIRLHGEATLDDLPIEISGELGPQAELLRAGRVTARLEGRLADAGVKLEGSFSDLASLLDPSFEVSVEGADIAAVTEALGVPSLGTGPFHLSGRLAGAALAGDVDVSLEAHLGDVEASAEGRVSSVLDPHELDLTVAASGPDLAAVTALAGVSGLPAARFDLSGGVVWDESGMTFDEVSAHLGDSSLRVNGSLALAEPRPEVRLDFALDGPDLSVLAEISDLEIPAAPFRGEGRITSGEAGLVLEGVDVAIGATSLSASGSLGSLPDLDGTTLDLKLVSEDLPLFEGLAGMELPTGSARMEGAITYGGAAVSVEGLKLSLSAHEADVEGSIHLQPPFVGTDLRLRLRGPDLAHLVGMIPIEQPRLPADPYELSGRAAILSDGYELDDVVARVGDQAVEVDGRLGSFPDLDGTDVTVRAEGARLADVEAFAELPPLPAEPFTVSGRVRVAGGVYQLTDATVFLGAEHVEADGFVGPFPELLSTDVRVSLGGPNLRQLVDHLIRAELIEGSELPGLPGEPYSLAGGLRVLESGYALTGVTAKLAETEVHLDGIVSSSPQLVGTELTLSASGPDVAAVGAIAAVELPAEPFEIHGRVVRSGEATRLNGVRVSLGDLRLEADGVLGDAPEFEGTSLDLRVEGSRTALVADYLAIDIPEKAFEIIGRIEGSAAQVSIEGFRVQLGESDIGGTLRADLREIPDFYVDLHSEKLNLRPLLKGAMVSGVEAPAAGNGTMGEGDPRVQGVVEESAVEQSNPEEGPPATTEFLIPDNALEFETLHSINATVRLKADVVQLPAYAIQDIELAAELRDGTLRLLPTSILGPNDGSFSASLTLTPENEGYRLETRIAADRLSLLGAFTEGVKKAEVPTVDFDLDLKGAGATPHDLMSNADGVLIGAVNPGFVEAAVFDLLMGDIVLRVLGAVNPFDKSESTKEIECVVALGRLEDGVMTLDPTILRTETVDLVGEGEIDFATEEFDFSWTMKNRKGIGLSLATLTDSSIRLGGTLASPRLEVTPLGQAVETTKVVATAGVWPALQGLWYRLTASKDRCGKAMKEARAARREFRQGREAKP